MTLINFENQRDEYTQEWWDLFLGRGLQIYIEEQIEAGTPLPVVLKYSPQFKVFDYIDENFYDRNGMTPIDFEEKMFQLLKKEIQSEHQLRRETIIDYVEKSGLGEHGEEIIDGMNQTALRIYVPLHDSQNYHPLYLRERLALRNSDHLLVFGLEYVDKWKMYHELFSG